MTLRSPIFSALAAIYEESHAARTGHGVRDVQPTFEELDDKVLEQTGRRLEGDSYEIAVTELRTLHGCILTIEWGHPRAQTTIHKVRLSPCQEAKFYAALGRKSPTQEREAWAKVFESAAALPVPMHFHGRWQEFCWRHHGQALAGNGWLPFRRKQRNRAPFQLKFAAQLLGWAQPCLLRTASARLTGDSKFFERCLPTMKSLLAEGSGGAIQSFADLAIEHTPTEVRFHGPLRARITGSVKDYDGLSGVSSLTEADIAAAEMIETAAPRCVSIENATTFHELCRHGCSDLLILTSYPNQATIDFLRHLPLDLPLFHWGDTDPWGFDVLRDLRRKTERDIAPLHMRIGTWAEELPSKTRARRRLTDLDRNKLSKSLEDDDLKDVRVELRRMYAAGITGDFEQEGLQPISGLFPYINSATTEED